MSVSVWHQRNPGKGVKSPDLESQEAGSWMWVLESVFWSL